MNQAHSPLRYPGGKTRAIKQILPRIPYQFTEYREPFIGGGSVFCAIRNLSYDDMFFNPQRFIINDINYDLACFWKIARDDIRCLLDGIITLRTQYLNQGRDLYEYLKSEDYKLINRA